MCSEDIDPEDEEDEETLIERRRQEREALLAVSTDTTLYKRALHI